MFQNKNSLAKLEVNSDASKLGDKNISLFIISIYFLFNYSIFYNSIFFNSSYCIYSC
jgi:hypothetical protein